MKICDFHSDILTSDGFTTLPEGYGEEFNVITALFRGKRTLSEVLPLAKLSPAVAFEDVGYEDFSIDALTSVNPLYVGLTWNGENRFGYGCDYKDGLKSDGKELVKLLNEHSITVDTAHISEGGFKDVIETADSVVNSHTCFSGVYSHKRNIADWQIELLLQKKGLIGLTLCGYFMTDKEGCTVEDVFRQIDYFCQKYGADSLAIGTDFYGTDFLPCENGDYGFFRVLKEKMLSAGYKPEDADKIFYKNLSGFYGEKIKNGRNDL